MEVQVLSRSELAVQRRVLKDHTYAGSDGILIQDHVMAEDAGSAARRPKHRGQDLDYGALAGSVGS